MTAMLWLTLYETVHCCKLMILQVITFSKNILMWPTSSVFVCFAEFYLFQLSQPKQPGGIVVTSEATWYRWLHSSHSTFTDHCEFDLLCQAKQPEHTDHWREGISKGIIDKNCECVDVYKETTCKLWANIKQRWTNEQYYSNLLNHFWHSYC